MAFQETGQAAAIAAEWGVNVELLENCEWEIDTIDGNDGELYGYLIRFDDDTDPETLSKLGLEPGKFTRQVSLNAFDELEMDAVDKPRIVGPGNSIAFAGSSFVGNSFAVRDSAQSSDEDEDEDEDEDDGIYSVNEPLSDISNFTDDDFEQVEPEDRSKRTRRAYNIDDERFTPSQFRRLSRARKVEAMVQWFHENYEDPAVRMPYESAEGGYQWIWGGPYDAYEQIGDQFSDIADLDAIEKAAAEIASDGLFDWAPKARREDYARVEDWNEPGKDEDWNQPARGENYTATSIHRTDRRLPPGEAFLTDAGGNILTDAAGNGLVVTVPQSTTTGSTFSNFTFGEASLASSRNFQNELLSRLENLEAALNTYRENLPPRNHNHPPELVEPDPLQTLELQIVVQITVELRAEAHQAKPDPEKLEVQASKLRSIAKSIFGWLGRKADKAVDSTIAWVVPLAGTAWMLAAPDKVYANLLSVAETVSAWAQQLSAGW